MLSLVYVPPGVGLLPWPFRGKSLGIVFCRISLQENLMWDADTFYLILLKLARNSSVELRCVCSNTFCSQGNLNDQ